MQPLNVLDLFAGLGGWSKPWREAGHNVFTVDYNPAFNSSLTADIGRLRPSDLPEEFRRPDVLCASPPCDIFAGRRTDAMRGLLTRGEDDLSLARATRNLIEEMDPRYWMVENVGAAKQPFSSVFGDLLARTRNVLPEAMRPAYITGKPYYVHYLWGKPEGILPRTLDIAMRPKSSMSSTWAAQRAEIPRDLSETFMRNVLAREGAPAGESILGRLLTAARGVLPEVGAAAEEVLPRLL